MALSLHNLVVLGLTLCVSLQEGFGLFVQQPGHRIRTKRCSCNNELDSECHYFCHLDIIWVNTPSKTTVYGLGSPLTRRRRDIGRCTCSHPADRICTSFCRKSPETASQLTPGPSTSSWRPTDQTRPNLLASLREAIKANIQAAQRGVAPRKKALGAHKLHKR